MIEEDYIPLIEQKLEKQIEKTPTGNLRDLLTELNILFKSKLANQSETVVLPGITEERFYINGGQI